MVAPIEYYALPLICVVYTVMVLKYVESSLKRFLTVSLGLVFLSVIQIVWLEHHLFKPENFYSTAINFLAIVTTMGLAPMVSAITFGYVNSIKPIISLFSGLACLLGFPVYGLFFICYIAGNCL